MEFELKFKINKKKDVLARLRRLGAEDLGPRKELDIFVGTAQKGLRVRKTKGAGLVTYKQIVAKPIQAKVREELETEVRDPDKLLAMLKMLGYPECKRREKIRHVFKLGKGYVLIDRMPFWGYFIELETSSLVELKRLVKLLGFDWRDGIRDSYDNIFLNYYLINARKFRDAKMPILPTFACEREFRKKFRQVMSL